MRKPVLAILASLVVAVLAGPACSDAVAERPCTAIPAGGCPLSRGVACECGTRSLPKHNRKRFRREL